MRDKLTYKQYAEGGFITNEKLTEDQYNFLTRELDYERKPYNQTDVYSSVTLKDLPEDIRTAIFNMKKIIVKDVDDLSFFKDRLDGNVQFYVLYINQEPYLVDTQGFDYARYVTKINDVDGELDPDYSDYVDPQPYAKGGKLSDKEIKFIEDESVIVNNTI